MNNIYFKEDFNNKAIDSLPQHLIDSYDIKFYNPSPGCIRTLDNKIIAIYFYVSTDQQEYAIIRFNYIDHEIVFDSIYLRQGKEMAFSNTKEYRYNKDKKLIASYDFYSNSPENFCIQHKEIKNTKKYTRLTSPKLANDVLKEASKKYLTKEITTELISGFYTADNKQEIYWLIE
jgi:hypothetical protein